MEGEIVVPHGCWKTKKLICGMEGKKLWLLAACLPSLLPQGYCKQNSLNLEKTTSSILSVLLLIYVFSYPLKKRKENSTYLPNSRLKSISIDLLYEKYESMKSLEKGFIQHIIIKL